MILVEFEFRRIQTFLFDAPQLRDMVGANVLLGEVIRAGLPRLAIRHGTVSVTDETLHLPNADPEDPIEAVEDLDLDNPGALYEMGILARDGGHFRAAFPTEEAAKAFCIDAQGMVLRQLPGLRFDIACSRLEENGKTTEIPKVLPTSTQTALTEAPLFELCAARGSGAAEVFDKFRKENVSSDVMRRRDAYRRFRSSGKARDIISLLRAGLPGYGETPPDLSSLCGNDYLAVIHADGNSVGVRAKEEVEGKVGTVEEIVDASGYLRREACFEAFFHHTRVSFRKAVATALNEVFGQIASDRTLPTEGEHNPYQLLMLGGDDLLFVCRAKQAVPFLIALADAMHKNNPDLTFGAGLVIASPKMPFHHLNDLAETLAGSAKRLYRHLSSTEQPCSVVDWHVETGSRTPDLRDLRRRSALIVSGLGEEGEQFVALQRPLRILQRVADLSHGQAPLQLDTLEGLHQAVLAMHRANAGKEGDHNGIRSQIRWLADQIRSGRRWSEHAFEELASEARTVLTDKRLVGLERLWQQRGDRRWSTPFLDLVELYEIENLATAGVARSAHPSTTSEEEWV